MFRKLSFHGWYYHSPPPRWLLRPGIQCAILSGSSPKASAFQTRPVALAASSLSVAVDPCETSVLDPHFINSCGNSGHSLIRDTTDGGSEPYAVQCFRKGNRPASTSSQTIVKMLLFKSASTECLTSLLLCTRRIHEFDSVITAMVRVTGYPDSIKESTVLGRGSRSTRCNSRTRIAARRDFLVLCPTFALSYVTWQQSIRSQWVQQRMIGSIR